MTSKRFELPSGGWVEMKDPNWLRARDREALIREMNGGKNAPEIEPDDPMSKMDAGFRGAKIMAGILITGWHLPYQPEPAEDGGARDWVLPSVDYTIMDELLAPDVVAIEEELKVAQKVLMPRKPSVDQHADPESPSTPESA